jgi:hypothetical protein
MSQVLDAIKEGLLKAKAPQELQVQINDILKGAINTVDSNQAQPYRQISLAIFKLFKPYDDYYPAKAERLIIKIMETNSFILQDFLDFERELNDRLIPIKQKLGLAPMWLLPARLLVGLLGFVIGFVVVSLLALPCAILFNLTLGQWFFVFVAGPAGVWLAKDFFRGVADTIENSRIPQAHDKNPTELSKFFFYKAMINLLRINYQNPIDIPSMKIAVADTIAALVFYNPDATSEVVQTMVNTLQHLEISQTSGEVG